MPGVDPSPGPAFDAGKPGTHWRLSRRRRHHVVMADSTDELILQTSLFGRVSLVLGPPLVLAVGLTSLAAEGPGILSLTLLVVGAALAVSALFFQPWTTAFTPQGIERRCLLRKDTLGWSEVDAIRRTPARKRVGGLMATTGERRRHLLTDRAESLHEFNRLRDVVSHWAPEVAFTARPPVTPGQP